MYDEIILQAGAKRAILDHLASLHKHFCAADNYGSTAPFWKNLEREKILQWLLLHTSVLTKKPGISSVISNQDDTLIVLSVVDKTYRTAVRDAFKPGGYMGHLEQHGMFNAPQQRQAAAAFVIGHEYKAIYGRVDLCVHFAWLPPLDGHSYQVVVPQDIMTTEEKTTWLT
ncbi:MAG: hypothetical protein HY879_18030 [Deltaproteobacteria bacterium]|nr:hypothetical protein [Deltaproteobacteria bacterium]